MVNRSTDEYSRVLDGLIQIIRRTIMVEGYEVTGMGGIANIMEDYLLSQESEANVNQPIECSLDNCNKCSNECM